MPYSDQDCDQIDATCRALKTKGNLMEPDQQTDTDTELITETLVEEVSIDGMCGVY
jgi:mycofactocin precursor peptide MftA